MAKVYRDWHEEDVDYIREHPDELAAYLDVSLQESASDGHWPAFKGLLARAIEATDGPARFAERVQIEQSALEAALSRDTPPRLDELVPILRGLGVCFSIRTLPPAEGSATHDHCHH